MWALRGKVALVTGARSAIGQAIVKELVKEEATVVCVGRKLEELHQTFNSLSSSGPPLQLMSCDINSTSDCETLVKQLSANAGGIDLLIHGAGLKSDGLFVSSKDGDMERVWKTNVEAPLRLTRLVLRHGGMLKKKDGAVVFVGSVVASGGNAGQVSYGASKAALEGASRSLAKEYGQSNIRFNVLASGLVADSGMYDSMSEKQRDALVSRTALGRAALPSEVGAAVVAMARMTYLTGAVLHLNGGM